VDHKRVTLLDYGMANLLNVARAFEQCGAQVTVTENAAEALAASRLVVPGVGSFQHAVEEMAARGLDDAVRQFAQSGRPLFGICVGMQMLFDMSEEFGEHRGLGILPGKVAGVPNRTTEGRPQRVPHIGWNHLLHCNDNDWSDTLLRPYQGKQPALYFVHSFAAQPAQDSDRLADCGYGGHRLCAAVQRGNIVATQFHPERSGEAGLALLQEFLRW
jgi:imidazole glycerol-phosphate synthase subunit HisH